MNAPKLLSPKPRKQISQKLYDLNPSSPFQLHKMMSHLEKSSVDGFSHVFGDDLQDFQVLGKDLQNSFEKDLNDEIAQFSVKNEIMGILGGESAICFDGEKLSTESTKYSDDECVVPKHRHSMSTVPARISNPFSKNLKNNISN